MEIYLVRHGQSEANVNRLVCGQMDVGLSEIGRDQVMRLGRILGGIRFTRRYSSPLRRAIDTASCITGIDEFVLEPRLMEMNTGKHSELTVSELLTLDGRFAHQGRHQYLNYPDGESLSQLYGRISSWFGEEMFSWADDDKILIVGHEATVSCVAHHVFQIPLDRYPTFIIPNASYILIQLDRVSNQARMEFCRI